MPELSYADCRCRVTWQLPPNSEWQDPLVSGTEDLHIDATIGVGQSGDIGEEDKTKAIEHLAEAREANFRWQGVGLVDGQNWAVRAGIRPSRCKISGITYDATWKAKRGLTTEPEREVEIALGLPKLVALS